MKLKPIFDNYVLEELRDIHGKIPKVGDKVKITLEEGIPNQIKEIKTDEFGYYRPYTLPYLEFEIVES